MSSKKGLSKDQKKAKMLEIFHESGEVFNYKEIEKIAQKKKGIVPQSVKAILQELIDDGAVETKKTAGTVLYWSFKAKKSKVLNEQISNIKEVLSQENSRAAKIQEILDKLQDSKSNMEEIQKIQEEISDLAREKEELESKLKSLKENNPVLAKKKQEDAKKLREAANRWTDNIFLTKSWCKQKFNVEEKDIDKNFGIPDNFDYIN